MRPRMNEGDYLFGISPGGTFPRRIVFAAKIAERMTFAEAHKRYPKLRGPEGPIHVRPAEMPLASFPDSHYEHIPEANHADDWRSDIRVPELDVFFVCEEAGPCAGRWLGNQGPAVKGQIAEFLKTCAVYGNAGKLSASNPGATEDAPVRYGKLYTGLHLETSEPERLLRMVCGNVTAPATPESPAAPARRPAQRRTC